MCPLLKKFLYVNKGFEKEMWTQEELVLALEAMAEEGFFEIAGRVSRRVSFTETVG